jgi:hypothetical protein
MAEGQFIGSSLLPLSRRAIITGILTQRSAQGKFVYNYRIAVISQAVASGASVSWTAYTGGTTPAATYNFAVSNSTYTFRTASNLPYGSYPGISAFTV